MWGPRYPQRRPEPYFAYFVVLRYGRQGNEARGAWIRCFGTTSANRRNRLVCEPLALGGRASKGYGFCFSTRRLQTIRYRISVIQ